MKKKRYLGWTITCIVVCVLFVPIIIFNLILSIKGSINKEELPSFLGISPTVVLSGSMSPEFEEKDLIFIWAVDTDELKAKSDEYEGDIICFYKDEEFITHRIARIEVVNGEKRFYTAGDYTGDLDDNYILADQIQGRYEGRIPKLGGVVLFLQSPYGLMMTIILLVMLYIAGELLFEIREVKWENKEIRGLMARLYVVLLSQKEKKAETDSELQRLREENERLQGLLNNNAPVENEIAVAVANIDDEEDVIIDSNGLKIHSKYKRSFMSRLIQSGDNTQDLYTQIKNHLLQYKGVRDRISWSYETFTNKRKPIVKLCMRGKTLYAYLALTDEEIETLHIDEKVDNAKYAAVPAKIKITGIIKLHRALKAIDVICARLGLEIGEAPTETYSYPYETDEQLLSRGLIKLIDGEFVPPVVENHIAEEIAVDEADDDDRQDDEAVIVVENGLNIKYKYKRSFTSRLIQSGDNTQDLYTQIKNHLLQYKGVRDRISWSYEAFTNKRKPIVKLSVRGKTLYAYLALTDEEIENLRIDEKVESVKYSAVPAKIRISGVIKLHRALKAIDVICARLGLVIGEKPTETYSYPYETDEQLLERGLIKLVKGEFVPPVVNNAEVPEEIDDGKGDSEVIVPVVVDTDVDSSDAIVPVVADSNGDNADAVVVPVVADSVNDDSSNTVIPVEEADVNAEPVDVIEETDDAPISDKKTVALSADTTASVNRGTRIKVVEVLDFSDEELPEDMTPYTRAQYLALSRVAKKKVKTLIRHVDEHLYDEDTPSNIKKRQIAELWRKATLPTNTRTLKIVEVKRGKKQ